MMTGDINPAGKKVIDKALVARCFAQARSTYEQEAAVQRQVAEKMMRLLSDAFKDYPNEALPKHLVEIGCGTGSFSRLLATRLQPATFLLNDLCPEMEECLTDLCRQPSTCFHAADAEEFPLPEDTELIASCSTIQWLNHLPGFFTRCRNALSNHGWLAFSTFGRRNIYQIRELTGNGLDYTDLENLKRMLEPDFEVIHAEEEVCTLYFDSPLEVLKHLKQTGVTGTEKKVWSRGRLQQFCENYSRLFSNEQGKVSLTYHPIYLLAKKK